MRYATIVFLVVLIPFSAYAQSESGGEADFRSINWGMSVDEVKERESAEFIQEGDGSLAYKVAGKDALVIYYVHDDIIGEAGYMFIEKHSNRNKYIDDFEEIEELLSKKYGEPDRSISPWYDDLYRDDPSRHGFAISVGDHAMQSVWEGSTTKILHILKGDNYDITHAVKYSSVELSDEIERSREEEALSDF